MQLLTKSQNKTYFSDIVINNHSIHNEKSKVNNSSQSRFTIKRAGHDSAEGE